MTMSRWMTVAALAVSLVLSACGGGGESNGFGAVAVSKTTSRVAISSEELTQSFANDEARDECDADDCTVVLQFEECGAAASGPNSSGVLVIAAAAGGTAFDAQTAANNACTAQGGLACTAIPNLAAECN